MTEPARNAAIDLDRGDYARYVKPRLMELLEVIGLDRIYVRGEGDRLWHRDEGAGGEVEVLDLLGGYGASLLGHNHPEVLARAKELLDAKVPFHAQASCRGQAGRLARRLSEMVGARTGRSYVVTLANSGTEAIEAAIKHAEIETAMRIDAILAGLKRRYREANLRRQALTAFVPDRLLAEMEDWFGVAKLADFDELFFKLLDHDLRTFEAEPVFLALVAAFHGKSTGSLQLTFNIDFRIPFQRIGLKTAFLRAGDERALERTIAEFTRKYLDLEIDDATGEVRVVERDFVNVGGFFIEPIQGEGGIREVPPGYLRAARAAADRHGFPLILDEIQSGMGRAGTFLASEASGVRGDYYTLSKALGAGLAKVAALLVDRDRYVDEFGWLHTSTFAEDDFSSALALTALEIVERDGLPERCREKGERLLARLREVQRRYPEQVRDVRGRGLMVGVELAKQVDSLSPTLRLLSEQDLLGFFISGHLLHEERIRVAPTLSHHGTIRLEPSAYVAEADLERFAGALERVCDALAKHDAARLARYVVGAPPLPPGEGRGEGVRGAVEGAPALRPPRRDAPPRFAKRVAFLGHFPEAADLARWDPSLASFDVDARRRFLERTWRLLEPFVSERVNVRSATGDSVNVVLIGLAFTSEQVIAAFRRGEAAPFIGKVEAAVELAKKLDCSVVGFGGFTSIVTGNLREIVEDRIAMTSGNSLTVGLAVEALFREARERGIDLGRARVGVVGAAGNIGALLAQLAAEDVPEVVLVGRRGGGSAARLRRAAAEVLFEEWKRIRAARAGAAAGAGRPAPAGLRGVAARLAGERVVERLLEPGGTEGVARVGEAILDGVEVSPVTVADDLGALRGCDLVLAASNAAEPIVRAEHIREDGPVAICDVAVPRDTDPALARERPNATVIAGGIVRLPFDQDLALRGFPLAAGQIYACMAETLLLGLTGVREHWSHGALTKSQVKKTLDLARMHGFEADRPKREKLGETGGP